MAGRGYSQKGMLMEKPKDPTIKLSSLLKEIISDSKCENCGFRMKAVSKKWCLRCIDRWSRQESCRQSPQKVIAKLVELVGDEYFHAEIEHLDAEYQEKLLTDKDIFLWGEIGVGKTYAMAALVKKYLFDGYDCERINFDDFCSKVRSTMNNNSKMTEYELVNQLSTIDKLFIDDVGLRTRQESDFAYITFYTILNKRIECRLQTFITTNKNIEQLAKNFDSRIASRLGLAVNIHMEGKDRRSQK